jgi:hypothetical protein
VLLRCLLTVGLLKQGSKGDASNKAGFTWDFPRNGVRKLTNRCKKGDKKGRKQTVYAG